MADRRTLMDLQSISEIRTLMTRQAAQAAVEANALATVDEASLDHAEQDLRSAAAAWLEYVSHSDFDLGLGLMLGDKIVGCEHNVSQADRQLHRSRIHVSKCHDRWQVREAEGRVGQKILANARNQHARHREEANLATSADVAAHRKFLA